MLANNVQEDNVSTAFSRQSVVFDDLYENNSITLWMRQRVRNEVLKYLRPGNRMLELNCGTGIDTMYFAKQGFDIVATDNAEGMLDALSLKVSQHGMEEHVSAKKVSFNDFSSLSGEKFDYIFSNFSGLNCTNDLAGVLLGIDSLLRPGGLFTFVIMPKVCPWEIAMLFKGDFKTAFRRFRKNGAKAHIESAYFNCYYYNPSYVLRNVRPGYTLRALKGLAIAMPPPFIYHFKEKHPKLFTALAKADDLLWNKPPFRSWCDQYLITMQKPIKDDL